MMGKGYRCLQAVILSGVCSFVQSVLQLQYAEMRLSSIQELFSKQQKFGEKYRINLELAVLQTAYAAILIIHKSSPPLAE